MTTVRLPLAGSQINTRNGSLAYDALLQNCIVEKAGEDPAVMKRDCFTPVYTASSQHTVQGVWEFGSSIYWIETYTIGSNSYCSLFSSNKPFGPPYGTVWIDGALSFGEYTRQMWASYDPTNGKMSIHSATKMFSEASTLPVTPPTASALVSGAAWLDGYFFVYSIDGNIYNSSLNDPRTWNALGAIKPNVDVGYPTRLVRYINYLIAFGDTGYTAFYDAANPGPASPLSPVPNLNGKVGCYSANTVTEVGNSLFWLGRSSDGTVSVYSMTGHEVKKVSTPAIDRYIKQQLTSINSTVQLNYLNGSSLTLSGHHGYYISLLGLWYDVETGSWSYMTDNTNYFGITNAWSIYFAAGNTVVYNKGSIGTLSNTVYQEYSTNIQVKIVTNEFDRANNWKFVNDIDFISDKNIGTPFLRWTDDDFSTWSSYYTFDTGSARSNIYRLGRTRRRAFELTHTDNTPFRAYYLEIDYDFGER